LRDKAREIHRLLLFFPFCEERGSLFAVVTPFRLIIHPKQTVYIFGRNTVAEALAAGKQIEKIFCQYGAEGSSIAALRIQAENARVPFALMDRRKFQVLEREVCAENENAQGIIALVAAIKTFSIGALIDQAFAASERPLFIALDGITDPHNVGAIARSAECAGFHGMIVPELKAAPLGGTAMKTSAGALQHIPVAKTSNLAKALEDCRNADFRIVALEADAGNEYSHTLQKEALFNEPLLLVIGSEGAGIQRNIRALCTDAVSIPVQGHIASLNASVAAGIVMFEIVRQRLLALTV
jgi:23S rRNA (guanosine2251-2'-O)-methyltransferase